MTPKQLAQLRSAPAYHQEVGGDLPLDPWIGFAVKVLRDAGIETIESCQGGAGHCYAEPTVRFGGTSTAGFRAFNAAMEYGLPVRSVQRAWTVEDSELTGPYWYMVFHPLAKLKQRQREAEKAGLLGALPRESPQRKRSV